MHEAPLREDSLNRVWHRLQLEREEAQPQGLSSARKCPGSFRAGLLYRDPRLADELPVSLDRARDTRVIAREIRDSAVAPPATPVFSQLSSSFSSVLALTRRVGRR
jgi:hypothetical protein